MLAFSYVRFSSPRQALGDSRRRQLDMTRRWCEQHGYTLSDQNFEDLGVSGWKGKNWREGGLSLFLDAVRCKKVKAGACLIVENLDRLSRDEIDRALTVFCDLLRAGIQVVTLSPERIYTKVALDNPTSLMECILQFILANEESTKKSNRLREVWANKRKTGGSMGGLCPAWLEWDKVTKTYRVIEPKADVVRLMFKLSADGLGSYAIARELHAKKIGSIGKGGAWNHSYISIILHSRAVIGECQMNHVVDGKRQPAVIVPNYYPAIVGKSLFYKVQEATAVRDGHARFRGRGSRNLRNLFAGLLVDARDGGSLVYYQQRNGKKMWKYVASLNAMRKVPSACLISFPYPELENTILLAITSMNAEQFRTNEADVDDAVAEKEGQLGEVKQNIDVIKKRIVAGSSAASLVTLLEELDARAKALGEEVEKLKRRFANDEFEMLDEVWDTIFEARKKKGKAELDVRQRLQGKLRQLIEKVVILLSKSPQRGTRGNPFNKHALVEIRFRNGTYWQMALSYLKGELVTDWEGQGESILSLPKEFNRNDPLARLPVPVEQSIARRQAKSVGTPGRRKVTGHS